MKCLLRHVVVIGLRLLLLAAVACAWPVRSDLLSTAPYTPLVWHWLFKYIQGSTTALRCKHRDVHQELRT